MYNIRISGDRKALIKSGDAILIKCQRVGRWENGTQDTKRKKAREISAQEQRVINPVR